MAYQKPPLTKLSDKFIGYCAVTPNRKFMRLFERAEVKNVLISYHYIRKDLSFTKDILQMVRDRGGLFMTDSGAFSFFNDKNFDHLKFDWEGYLLEYVDWLGDNKDYIFSACNLDVDAYVSHDTVDRWNRKHFEPLSKDINVIYVAHQNVMGRGDLDVFKKYCKEYNYVAVNESMSKHVSAIYQEAKITKTAIHGLAWTKPTILQDFPFFSVDSSSWVNYQKYGATPVWDGKNFSQYDKDNKDIRKTLRNQCSKYGIKEYEFVNEKNQADGTHNDDEGLTYSLRTWCDVFESLKVTAKTKLTFDLDKMLKGKKTVFMEQKNTPATKPLKKAGIDIANLQLGEDLEVMGEAASATYAEDEEGNEVVVYKKREQRISISAYKEEAGDLMVCNFCHIQDKCPKYAKDNTCAFDFAPNEMTKDPMAVIDMLIKAQTERVQRAMFIEKMEGGMPNKVFAGEVRLLETLNSTKVNMMMLVQGKGFRVTMTEYQSSLDALPNSNGGEKSGGGFAAMITALMKHDK